jgi:hypothetical protein
MKRLGMLLLALSPLLMASDSGRLYELYQNGRYVQACNEGVKKLRAHRKDEKYVSLYAFACLQADKIDRLAVPIIMLKHSREARKNAAYFSAILLQKNLLLSALENDQSLASLTLPSSDYVLSKVFDLYSGNHFVKTSSVYVLKDPENPRQTYRLSLQRSGKNSQLRIDEYYDTILTKQHLYR